MDENLAQNLAQWANSRETHMGLARADLDETAARVAEWLTAVEAEPAPLAAFERSISDKRAAGFAIPGEVIRTVCRLLSTAAATNRPGDID
jgi:hypothetical protein